MDFKEKLTIISDDLNHSIITENEARTLLLGLLGVSGSAYFDADFICPKCGSTAAEPPLRLTARIRSGTWKCSDCGYDYGIS